MKHLKKIVLGLVAVASVAILAGCQKSSPNTAIVSMKGHQIQVTDLYQEAKTFPNLPTSTLLQNLTFNYIFEKEYGKQVSSKDVDKEFNKNKKEYGATFDSQLQQQGLTEDSYKKTLRLQLLENKAVDKKIADSEYTQKNLAAEWKTYHPEVSTYIASTTKKSDATQTRDLALNNTDTFKSQANDKNLEMKFDSASTKIPDKVKTAAFKLKNDTVSDVLTIKNPNTGAENYYVIYMIKNTAKGNDMNKYKPQLEAAIKTEKENDQKFVATVIKSYLTKYNVTVKDTSFNSVFSQFTGTN